MTIVNMSSFGSMKKNVPPTPSQRYSPSGQSVRVCDGAHRKAETETAVGARKIELVARDSGLRPDMVRGHQRDRLGLKIALAVEGAAVQQHLRKARVVSDRADHAGAAGFPASRQHRIADAGDRTE